MRNGHISVEHSAMGAKISASLCLGQIFVISLFSSGACSQRCWDFRMTKGNTDLKKLGEVSKLL